MHASGRGKLEGQKKGNKYEKNTWVLVCGLSAEEDWFLEEVTFLCRYLRANSRVFTDCKQTSSRLKDKRASRTFVKKGGWAIIFCCGSLQLKEKQALFPWWIS